jgi:hypothetical protein
MMEPAGLMKSHHSFAQDCSVTIDPARISMLSDSSPAIESQPCRIHVRIRIEKQPTTTLRIEDFDLSSTQIVRFATNLIARARQHDAARCKIRSC